MRFCSKIRSSLVSSARIDLRPETNDWPTPSLTFFRRRKNCGMNSPRPYRMAWGVISQVRLTAHRKRIAAVQLGA